MKSKSKLGKIKELKKPKETKLPDKPTGWYLMVSDDVTVEDIKACLDDSRYDIEIWKDMGILEIGVAENTSVDVESVDLDLRDEYSNAFLADHNVRSLFYLTIKRDTYEACLPVFETIAAAFNCIICGDTEDFNPIIKK